MEPTRSRTPSPAFAGASARFYAAGWKLAHIEDVGLHTRLCLEHIPIDLLEDHFRKLMLPSNLFAIPKVRAGLGEVPEVIEAIRASGDHDLPRFLDSLPRPGLTATQYARVTGGVREAANGEDAGQAGGRATRANTYPATRLLFKASVIEQLADDQAFRIETPDGTYEMTKAQFRRTFANVAESNTYTCTGVYSYNRTPEKARRFLVNHP